MKRSLLTVFLGAALAVIPLQAQNVQQISDSIDKFVTDFTPALPNLAETGLLWSQSYIGEFPKLGAGITVNGAFIPKSTFQGVADALGVPLPAEIAKVPDWLGLPIPAYTAEARIGGFILPFDIGVKYGFIPDSIKITDVTMDYLLVGADVRIKVLDSAAIIIPRVSVGAGVNYLKGSVAYNMGTIALASVSTPGGPMDIYMDNTKAKLAWEATVVNAHAQADWDLFFLTPFVGVDLSYANAKSGATFSNTLMKGSVGAGTPVTQTDLDNLNAYNGTTLSFDQFGFNKTGITKGAVAYKIMAGTSINLIFIVLDVNAGYNPVAKSIAAGVNARLRLY